MDKRIIDFDSHVYNLQTSNGEYIIPNFAIVGNCRCYAEMLLPEDLLNEHGLTNKPVTPRKKVTRIPVVKPTAKVIEKVVKKKPVPVVKSIPQATTLAEAEEIAIKYLDKTYRAKYKNIALETANDINNALYKMQNKYGALNINGITTYKKSKSGVYMSAVLEESTLGVQVTNLKINTARVGGKYKELNNYIKKQNEKGLWIAENVEDVTTHEAGHFLSYRNKKMVQLDKQTKDLDHKIFMENWKIEGSQYSTENADEFVAEGFLKHEKGGELPTDILNAVKDFTGVK